MLLKRSNLKDDTKVEVEATVAILEKLLKPKPPNVKGHFYNNIEKIFHHLYWLAKKANILL